MLENLSLAIRYGLSLRSGPNLMVLVKGLPTWYTYTVVKVLKWSIEEYHKISMVNRPAPSFYMVLYWRNFIHLYYTTLHGVEQRLHVYQGYYCKRIIFSLYDICRTLNFLLFSVNLISFTVCSFALILKALLVWISRWRFLFPWLYC